MLHVRWFHKKWACVAAIVSEYRQRARRLGETYLEAYDIHCTDYENNPYGIQWIRYGDECTLPTIVKETV